jgi:hypothetical protein
MFQTKFLEKNERHVLCSIKLSFENYAVYDTMCKNIVEADKQRMTMNTANALCLPDN